jgi:hypothetical protein
MANKIIGRKKTLKNYIRHIVTIFGGHKLILNQRQLKIIIGYVNFIKHNTC